MSRIVGQVDALNSVVVVAWADKETDRIKIAVQGTIVGNHPLFVVIPCDSNANVRAPGDAAAHLVRRCKACFPSVERVKPSSDSSSSDGSDEDGEQSSATPGVFPVATQKLTGAAELLPPRSLENKFGQEIASALCATRAAAFAVFEVPSGDSFTIGYDLPSSVALPVPTLTCGLGDEHGESRFDHTIYTIGATREDGGKDSEEMLKNMKLCATALSRLN